MNVINLRTTALEKFLIYHRRSGSRYPKDFHIDYWAIREGHMPIPSEYQLTTVAAQRRFDDGLSAGEVAYLLRERADLSLRQMADHLRTSHMTVQNWEKDEKGDPLPQIVFLCERLSIPMRGSYDG